MACTVFWNGVRAVLHGTYLATFDDIRGSMVLVDNAEWDTGVAENSL